jgi:hypothetical protein
MSLPELLKRLKKEKAPPAVPKPPKTPKVKVDIAALAQAYRAGQQIDFSVLPPLTKKELESLAGQMGVLGKFKNKGEVIRAIENRFRSLIDTRPAERVLA